MMRTALALTMRKASGKNIQQRVFASDDLATSPPVRCLDRAWQTGNVVLNVVCGRLLGHWWTLPGHIVVDRLDGLASCMLWHSERT